MVACLLLGGGLRVVGIDIGLSYIRHVDEPNFYRMAQGERGVLDAGYRNQWLAGYPPGYIWQYARLLDLADATGKNDLHQHMARYVAWVRAFNVLIDWLNLALVMGLALRLGGGWVGSIAGLVYASSAPLVEHAAYALPDTATTFWVLLCAWMTWQAFRQRQPWWGLAAVLAGCIATVMKYPAALVLVLPALYFLALLGQRRARALGWGLLAAALVAGTAYGLLVVYGAMSLDNIEASNVRNFFWRNLTDPQRLSWTLNGLQGILGWPLLILGGAGPAGLGTALARGALAGAVALVLVFGLLTALVPAYLSDNIGARYPTRYVHPGAALLLPALATGLAWLTARLPLLRLPLGGRALLAGLACAAWFIGPLTEHLALSRQRNSQELAQRWVLANVQEEDWLWMESGTIYTTFSRYDRGFYGPLQFSTFLGDSTPRISLQEREQMDYVLLLEEDRPSWPRGQGWESLDELNLLLRIEGPGIYGPPVLIYEARPRLPARQDAFRNARDVLSLRGLRVGQQGQTLYTETTWQAERPPTRDYAYVLFVTPAEDDQHVIVMTNGQLGLRRSSTWVMPQEAVRGGLAPLSLPPDLPTGDYQLWIAVYDWESGERLALADGSTSLLLHGWSAKTAAR